MVSKGKINIGVHIPPEGKSFEEMKKYVQTAEKLGFDLFTITDHFLNMGNPRGEENHPLECWTTLAGLAATTKTIYLAPLVSCAHYRLPTVLAKMATTVDIISGGRFILGLGAGWLKEEFESFIGGFPSARERLDGLEDAAIICREMFRKGVCTYHGKKFSAVNALNRPRPVRGDIPIMIGATGEKRALKIAAKHADIIHITGFPTIPIAEHKIEVIKKHCSDVGRNFQELLLGIGLVVMLREDEEKIEEYAQNVAKSKSISIEQARNFAHNSAGPKNIANLIREFNNIGIELFTLPGLNIEDMKIFAEEVLPKLH